MQHNKSKNFRPIDTKLAIIVGIVAVVAVFVDAVVAVIVRPAPGTGNVNDALSFFLVYPSFPFLRMSL